MAPDMTVAPAFAVDVPVASIIIDFVVDVASAKYPLTPVTSAPAPVDATLMSTVTAVGVPLYVIASVGSVIVNEVAATSKTYKGYSLVIKYNIHCLYKSLFY